MEKLGLHENLPGSEALVKTASVSGEFKKNQNKTTTYRQQTLKHFKAQMITWFVHCEIP